MDLTAADRRHLAPSQFAGPDRSYPINDRTHQILAIARAHQMVREGRLSPSEAEVIVARARHAMGENVLR